MAGDSGRLTTKLNADETLQDTRYEVSVLTGYITRVCVTSSGNRMTVRQGKHTLQDMLCELLEATQLIFFSIILLFFRLLLLYLERFMLKWDILLYNLSFLHADVKTSI